MFTRIARRYDVMNTIMTGGRHHAWRRLAAEAVVGAPPGPVLDLATGTGDLALAVRAVRPASMVVGVDFSEGMLHQARPKLARRGETRVPLLAADALALPFRDRVFAAVTSAFVVRNLVDLARGRVMSRVTTRPPESVERFASPPGLADAMRRAGLRDVRYRRFGFGTIALHVGIA